MKLRTSLLLLPITLAALGFAGACANNGSTGGSGDGDGDGDGDTASGGSGDGDGDIVGDGDGDLGGAGGAGDCGACPNDNDPCTEDECNPETGECGIPRSGNACDDGVYCNGGDTCEDGECSVHEGDPCAAACNEGADACECETVEDCPGNNLAGMEHGEDGEWGTIDIGASCQYDNDCDEACSCSVTKVTYECNSGQCDDTEDDFIDNSCDTRETDGDPCASDDVFCNGTEKCEAGSCETDASTAPACPGGPAYCYGPLDACVTCLPGTFRCTYTDQVVEHTETCLSNGEWDINSFTSCNTGANLYCDPENGGCKSGFFSPKDHEFELPKLLEGLPPLERGVSTERLLGLTLRSEFG